MTFSPLALCSEPEKEKTSEDDQLYIQQMRMKEKNISRKWSLRGKIKRSGGDLKNDLL